MITSVWHPAADNTALGVLIINKIPLKHDEKDQYLLQFIEFGLIAGYDLITGTHSSASRGNREVIASNCDRGSKHTKLEERDRRKSSYPPLKS